MTDSEGWLNCDEWPELISGIRKLYINRQVDSHTEREMSNKGYELIDVRTMPIETSDDKKEIIQAHLIGMADRTLFVSEDQRKGLELLAKTEGLLISKSLSGKLSLALDGQTLTELLSFGSNRHTLKRATEEEIAKAQIISITPGGETDGEIGKGET